MKKIIWLLLFIVLCSFSTAVIEVSSNNTIDYDFSTLDGADIQDLTGTNDGQISGAASSSNSRLGDGSYYFDNGGLDYIITESLAVFATKYSLEFWLNSTEDGDLATDCIFERDGNKEMYIATEEAVAPFEYFMQSGDGAGAWDANYCSGNVDLDDGLFHHLIVTIDSVADLIKVYKDGVSVLNCSDGLDFFDSGVSKINLGNRFNHVAGFEGYLDNFRMWTTQILSQEEVTYLYNGSAGVTHAGLGYVAPPGAPFSTSLFYPTNETIYYDVTAYDGRVAIDYSDDNGSVSCTINDSRWTFDVDSGTRYTFVNNTQFTNVENISILVICDDTIVESNVSFWFMLTSNFSISLDYPINSTTYYGDYNGSVVINFTQPSSSASCTINDSRWTFDNTDSTTVYSFINNTKITQNNVSIYIECVDLINKSQNLTFWYYLETILDVYFFDEATLQLLNKTITFDLIYSTGADNYTTKMNLSIYSIIPGEYEISYASEGYVNRRSYLTVIEGQKHNISLFLVNSSTVSQIIANLYDEFGNKLSGYIIKTYRRISGDYYHVETSKTNTNGQTDFNAALNTPLYYWLIYSPDGETLYKQTLETEIYGTTLDFDITLTSPVGHIFNTLGTYLYSLDFDNTTNKWTYIFIDQSGTSVYNNLAVYKAIDNTLIATNGTTSTTGILTINMNGLYENGSTYIASATANASPSFEIDVASWTYSTIPPELGEIGLFMTLIIFILVAMIGFWNPGVMFIMEAFAVILTRIVGLHQIGYVATTTIVVILFIFAYIVSDRT